MSSHVEAVALGQTPLLKSLQAVLPLDVLMLLLLLVRPRTVLTLFVIQAETNQFVLWCAPWQHGRRGCDVCAYVNVGCSLGKAAACKPFLQSLYKDILEQYRQG